MVPRLNTRFPSSLDLFAHVKAPFLCKGLILPFGVPLLKSPEPRRRATRGAKKRKTNFKLRPAFAPTITCGRENTTVFQALNSSFCPAPRRSASSYITLLNLNTHPAPRLSSRRNCAGHVQSLRLCLIDNSRLYEAICPAFNQSYQCLGILLCIQLNLTRQLPGYRAES